MRSVRRSKCFETMVRQLAETNHPYAGRPVFPTMRELMCFAAVLGFEKDRKRPLDSDTMEIDGRTFETHEQSRDLIYLIAIADAKDAEVLRDDKEREDEAVGIFEQYAQGGFEILASWLKERPEDANGDEAILAALDRYGFLGQPRSPDEAAADVKF